MTEDLRGLLQGALLTAAALFPIVTALDYGLPPEEFAIWFGILVLIVVEVGLITPPVGMNLFVLNALLRGVALREIFRGVWLFVVALCLALVVVLEVQPLALWLPSLMK